MRLGFDTLGNQAVALLLQALLRLQDPVKTLDWEKVGIG